MKSESTATSFVRSIAMGVLLSILSFYAIHVFGTWRVENYRPDPETTGSVQLHNKCAILEKDHMLRPNTDVSTMGDGIDGIKLGASFMIFFDGHIGAMIIFALLAGGLIFVLRSMLKKSRQTIAAA